MSTDPQKSILVSAPGPAAPPDELLLEFADNRLLIELCGEFDRNIAQIEHLLGVQILRRGNVLAVYGDARARAGEVLAELYARAEAGRGIEPGDIDAAVRLGNSALETGSRQGDQIEMFRGDRIEIATRKRTIEPRTQTQNEYVRGLFDHELVFGIGPAGTGKTYLAVAVAVNQMVNGHVDKIILSRPAVEAGERLGFLPGTEKDKMDPYMRPLYDALNDFLPGKQLAKLMEDNRIEIAPLAFMRGRTLSNAFIVLDEAQNATVMQMKMFLTRLGQGSRMVITGDRSQVDLPRGVTSGLRDSERILTGVDGIHFSYFTAKDVVRHPMVAKIIDAYDADEATSAKHPEAG
ncbi:MAG: PhoH family protein [Pseudomonadota bacterium]